MSPVEIKMMLSQLLFCLLFVAFCESATIKNKCRRVLPQHNVDWTRLQGEWVNLMFVPSSGTFVNCRKMRISDVNKPMKVVNMDFTYVTYGSDVATYRNDEFIFRWRDVPGLIHTTLKDPSIKRNKKTAYRRNTALTEISHTLASTDYQNYMIMLQCNEHEQIAWISLRDTNISENLVLCLRTLMAEYGFPVDTIKLSSTCS